ncbi:ferredoxin reductase family protein [Demequina sp.]|uniref:ferredoxin reductase family protein n=1 Tax=Demequina sp. TaxID=2050685 RepID=UPI0025C34920|nr:ferredoxin reductase family protein [Demequina sp.]
MRVPITTDTYEDRAETDSAWKDTLESIFWLTGVGALSLMLATGAPIGSIGDALTTIGRATGIVAATMMMVQLLVIARVPVIEHRLGHDRAALLHGRLGRIGFIVICVHVATLVLGYGARVNTGWWDQAWSFALHFGDEMTLAVIGFWLLIAVVATSLAAVRTRWKYERWHAVHMLTYITIAVSIPHQFVNGTTFSGYAFAATDTLARWYWAMMWTVSVGAFLVYRWLRPLWHLLRHRITVARVDRNSDGTISVWMTGRLLQRMHPRAGQFFMWRFLSRGMWTEAHPFSLSRSPRGDVLRITVKPVGDHTAAISDLLPGTKVMAEGPLGRFTAHHRRAHGTVLAGAGSGIAPMVAILEELDSSGPIVVFLRARDASEIPHLDEVRELARERGATLYLLEGRRSTGWLPQGQAATMTQLVPAIAASDVYVCGPEEWAKAVLDEARACGAPEEHLHREEFAW